MAPGERHPNRRVRRRGAAPWGCIAAWVAACAGQPSAEDAACSAALTAACRGAASPAECKLCAVEVDLSSVPGGCDEATEQWCQQNTPPSGGGGGGGFAANVASTLGDVVSSAGAAAAPVSPIDVDPKPSWLPLSVSLASVVLGICILGVCVLMKKHYDRSRQLALHKQTLQEGGARSPIPEPPALHSDVIPGQCAEGTTPPPPHYSPPPEDGLRACPASPSPTPGGPAEWDAAQADHAVAKHPAGHWAVTVAWPGRNQHSPVGANAAASVAAHV
eukprot:TRINITY_DN60794_c0_g1_i1.p1 TRINITY_DN60794_c0_g1~~TRINITY_DN60794_c0_g1_i1.p1  ORF type:complete len:275 (+),score=36.84 TRINITY_DN60794_c0_g1_i1:85-909(+)